MELKALNLEYHLRSFLYDLGIHPFRKGTRQLAQVAICMYLCNFTNPYEAAEMVAEKTHVQPNSMKKSIRNTIMRAYKNEPERLCSTAGLQSTAKAPSTAAVMCGIVKYLGEITTPRQGAEHLDPPPAVTQSPAEK